MPIVTLKYKLPEEKIEFELASKGINYHNALWDVANEIFRPICKYGYPSDYSAKEYFENLSQEEQIIISNFVEKLQTQFYKILENYKAELG